MKFIEQASAGRTVRADSLAVGGAFMLSAEVYIMMGLADNGAIHSHRLSNGEYQRVLGNIAVSPIEIVELTYRRKL